MALNADTSVGRHLQARYPTNFNTALQTAFSVFVDFEWTASAAQRAFLWFRRSAGFYAGIDSSGRLYIDDFVNRVTLTGFTLTTGRYRFFATWDDTTVTLYGAAEGGAISSVSSTSFNPGSASATAPGVAWGTRDDTFADDVTMLHVGCLWNATLDASYRFDLFAGQAPWRIEPENIFWMPGWYGEGDLGPQLTNASPFDIDTLSGSTPAQNIGVLKDPSTHEPVLVDSKYWMIGNTADEATLELYSSSDLTTWAKDSNITTAATEGVADLGACDFIYDSGADRPYQVLYWAEATGTLLLGINVISTASLAGTISWTNEAANPIFHASDYTRPTGNGPEDFRVALDDAGDWVAVFEKNNFVPGNAVGIAKNTSARLAAAFTYQGDLYNGDTYEEFASSSDIIANPVIIKKDGLYYCFYEHRVPSPVSGNNTFFAVSEDPGDPASWVPLGGAATPDNLENGIDEELFPNAATIESGVIKLYCQNQKKYTDAGLDQVYEPGLYSPLLGSTLFIAAPVEGAAVTGTAAQALAGLAQAAQGAESLSGVASQRLGGIGQAASGAMQPAGAAVNALGALAQAAQAVEEIAGAIVQEIGGVRQAASGVMQPAGAAAQTLAPAAQAASGVTGATAGAVAQAVAALRQAAAAVSPPRGAAAQDLGAVRQAAAGEAAQDGAVAQALAALAQAAQAAEALSGTVAQELGALRQAAAGSHVEDAGGAAAQRLAGLEQAIVAVREIEGAIAFALGEISVHPALAGRAGTRPALAGRAAIDPRSIH